MVYVAFYDIPEYARENRSAFSCAVAVVDYMTEVLSNDRDVILLSPARSLNKRGCYKARTHELKNGVTVKLPASAGVRTPVGRALLVAYTRLWLYFSLLKNVKKGDTVISYHSMSTIGAVRRAVRRKGARLILEVREIYGDINRMSAGQKKREREFLASADGYVFATELLSRIVNKQAKPYVVIPAMYKPEEKLAEKYNDGKIHVVYAGTFRTEKGGVINAVRCAEYLDERYHLHIMGRGGDREMQSFTAELDAVKAKTTATVTYDGFFNGAEFKRRLQKCHVGLATQSPEGAFNMTSFPSKIMTYLANGLDVVSVSIPAVTESPVGEYLRYCQDADPNNIAQAVIGIDPLTSPDKSAVLEKLDRSAKEDLSRLLAGNLAGKEEE